MEKEIVTKKYSRPLKVLVGNAATGHQITLTGKVESDSSFTAEMIMKAGETLADEADKLLLKMLRDEWEGPSAIEGSWNDENNQIMSIVPASRLVLPTPVAVYNKKGIQLFGKDLKKEILRRIDQWNQWEKNGQLQVEKEIHTTDDGKLIEIQFRVAPERLHPNEVNAEREWAVNNLIDDKENIRIREEVAPDKKDKGKEITQRGNKRKQEQNDDNVNNPRERIRCKSENQSDSNSSSSDKKTQTSKNHFSANSVANLPIKNIPSEGNKLKIGGTIVGIIAVIALVMGKSFKR